MKTYILRYVICDRQRGIQEQLLMDQLSEARVTPSRAFIHTVVYYAGPLTIKTWKGRSPKPHTGWICVFVCLLTSAVHLIMVYSCEHKILSSSRYSLHTLFRLLSLMQMQVSRKCSFSQAKNTKTYHQYYHKIVPC